MKLFFLKWTWFHWMLLLVGIAFGVMSVLPYFEPVQLEFTGISMAFLLGGLSYIDKIEGRKEKYLMDAIHIMAHKVKKL